MVDLITVMSITLVAAIVPGPDFVVVMRNTLVAGRSAGIMTELGIALALCVHIAYALAGIGLIISQSIFLFNALKLLGAAYLIYLGVVMVKTASAQLPEAERVKSLSGFKALRWGFLTNVTNPKATIFTLSVFLQVVSAETGLGAKLGYGLVMAGGVFGWFVLVALFFTVPQIRRKFLSIKLMLERSLGALLTGLGLGIAFTTISNR